MLSRLIILCLLLLTANLCQTQTTGNLQSRFTTETKYAETGKGMRATHEFIFYNHSRGLPPPADVAWPGDLIGNMIQTKDGMVWLSLNWIGLVRYDGKDYYRTIPLQNIHSGEIDKVNKDTLELVHLQKICKSKSNGLWAISYDRSLFWFDFKTYKFSKLFQFNEQSEDSNLMISSRREDMNDLIEDNNGLLWLWGSGLYNYNVQTKKLSEITQATDANTGELVDLTEQDFDEQQYKQFELASDGSFWLSDNRFVEKYLYHIITNTKTVLRYRVPFDFYGNIFYDSTGKNVWMAEDEGITMFDSERNIFTKVKFPHNFWLTATEKQDRDIIKYTAFYYEDNGQLWFRYNLKAMSMGLRSFQLKDSIDRIFDAEIDRGDILNKFLYKGNERVRWVIKDHELYSYFEDKRFSSYKTACTPSPGLMAEYSDPLRKTKWFAEYRAGEKYLCACDSVKGLFLDAKIPGEFFDPRMVLPLNDDQLLVGGVAFEEIYSPLSFYNFNIITKQFTRFSENVSGWKPGLTTDSITYRKTLKENKDYIWDIKRPQGSL